MPTGTVTVRKSRWRVVKRFLQFGLVGTIAYSTYGKDIHARVGTNQQSMSMVVLSVKQLMVRSLMGCTTSSFTSAI
jgi:hypothetical protein